jgi:hypothetical protein
MLIYFIIIIYVEVIFVSKFCEFCGAQIGDNAASCPVCNATPSTNNITASDNETVSNAGVTATPVTENVENNNASTDTAVSPTATANTPDSKKIITIVVAVFAALVFLSIVVSVLGSGYKKPLDNFCKAFNKEDAKYLVKAYPEIYTEEYDEDDMEDDLKDVLEELEDKYGKNIKLKYKVNDKEKIDKDDLEDLEDNIENYLDETVKISRGWELEVEFTVKGKKKERTKEIDVYVVKMDGKWAIVELSPDTIYYRFT